MVDNEFTCVTCGESFETGVELEQHNREAHSQFKCEICEQVFDSEKDLEAHNLLLHPDRQGNPKTW